MYNNVIYNLDLCTLTYQLHAQSHLWPLDPYYEYTHKSERSAFKAAVREVISPKQIKPGQKDDHLGYRGHAVLAGSEKDMESNGWKPNDLLDFIVSDYRRVDPSRVGFTRPRGTKEPWLLYNTPKEITERIAEIHISHYKWNHGFYKGSGHPDPSDVKVQKIAFTRARGVPSATDYLYCFEGGTGGIENKTGQKRYSYWSLMGFCLARELEADELGGQVGPIKGTSTKPYDIHIAFRGSRSGDPRIRLALEGKKNPDWVTDMATPSVSEDPEISTIGSATNGFRSSIKTMLPTIFGALDAILKKKNGIPPRQIHVTGHSLGGGLACHFCSAVLLGTLYDPEDDKSKMPDEVRNWPWGAMNLVTFSAPVVGGNSFHYAFNDRLASRRYWLDGDPVTQERRHYPVGKAHRIPASSKVVVMTQLAHSPENVRWNLIKHYRSSKIPLDRVPAQNERYMPETPWRAFRSGAELLEHLEKLSGKFSTTKNADMTIPRSLTGSFDSLRAYTQVVRKRFPGATQNNWLDDISGEINKNRGISLSFYQKMIEDLNDDQVKQLESAIGERTQKMLFMHLYFAAYEGLKSDFDTVYRKNRDSRAWVLLGKKSTDEPGKL